MGWCFTLRTFASMYSEDKVDKRSFRFHIGRLSGELSSLGVEEDVAP
jgi:hypothetical protein